MSNMQLISLIEIAVVFGGIMGFCWWQIRLMRRDIDDSEGSALARPAPSEEAAE
ncbi:MAG: hypothetical protein KTR21_04980 [Rhodobacteraceae bacterium]|nr:hypothetical protein [Paracoccaceae bacterium]